MRSLRTSSAALAAVALAASQAAVAPAATPPGAAKTLRPAQAADHAARPAMRAEWWTLRARDPRSRAAVEIRVFRWPHGTWLVVQSTHATYREAQVEPPVATARRLTARGPGAAARIDVGRERVVADASGADFAARVSLRHLVRGPAALGFQLGRPDRPGTEWDDLRLSWSLPVATSIARGSVRIGPVRVDFDRWRASYEHGWGHVYAESLQPWDLWDSYVVERRRGEAWVAFGLNRNDTVTGPGARDAMWVGMLAHATRRGVRACRPEIHRGSWHTADWREGLYARTLRARCGGMRASFADKGDRGLGNPIVNGPYASHFDFGRPATVGGRGVGWAEHRGTMEDAGDT